MEASRAHWTHKPEAIEIRPIETGIEAKTVFGWFTKSIALIAALFLGTIVTMGIFVVLPPPGGESRFDMRRRQSHAREAVGREAGAETRFELFGPLRKTPRSVAFSWAIAGDSLFDSYEVHYSKDPEFTPNRTTLFANPLQHASMTSIEVAGLDCASTYYFKVRKNDRSGRFSDSGELAARTDACPDTTTFRPYHADFASYYEEEEALYAYADMDSAGSWNDGDDSQSTNTVGTPLESPNDSREAEPVRLYPATYVTAGSAHVVWSDDFSSDFVSYEIHVSQAADFLPSARTQQTEVRDRYRSRLALESLECGETYFVIVRTKHDDGTVRDSNVERFTTQPCGSTRSSAAGLGL